MNLNSDKFFKKIFQNYRIVQSEEYFKINTNVEHAILEIENYSFEEKLAVLQSVIEKSDYESFMIFTKNDKIHDIIDFFRAIGFPACEISANKKETENSYSFYKFKNNEYPILICSDSMNRGVHFDFPIHVIQFDCATNVHDFLHRFGRTGRLGNKGLVTTFAEKKDLSLVLQIQHLIENNENLNKFSKYVKYTSE